MTQEFIWADFALFLSEIVNTSLSFGDNKQALEYINHQMKNNIYPKLVLFRDEAKIYMSKRDDYNNKIKNNVNSILSQLRKQISNIQFNIDVVVMSSYQARLNLINDSDLDIGLLVKDLDDNKLSVVSQYLLKNGYKFIKTVNPLNIKNCYHSFEKNIDNIEVEVKVRDMNYSKIIVNLHDFLDNNLNEEERALFTFAKYKLKNLNDRKGYNYLKKLIYEYGFSCTDIDNGFLLIM